MGVVLRSVAWGFFICLWITEPVASLTGEYCAIDASLSHAVIFAALCCALAAYLLAIRIGRGFSLRAWIAVSLLLMMLNMAANDLVLLGAAVLPLAVSLFFYACYGVGLGFAMCCFVDYLNALDYAERKLALAVSFGVGAAAAIPYGLMLRIDFVVLALCIGLCGLLAILVLTKGWKERKPSGRPSAKGGQGSLVFKDSIVRVFASMLALGVVAGYRIGLVEQSGVTLRTFFFVSVALIAVVAVFAAFLRKPVEISFLVAGSKVVIALSVFAVVLFLGNRVDNAALFTMMVSCFQIELFIYFLLYVTAFSYRNPSGLGEHLALITMGGSLGIVAGNLMNVWIRPSLGLGDYICVAILLATLAFSINGKMFVAKGGRGDADKSAEALLFAPEFSADDLESFAPAMAAKYSLTPAQTEVFFCLLQRERPKAIAQRFSRSEATIRSHVSQIYLKMEVNSSDDLLRKAHEFFDNVLP